MSATGALWIVLSAAGILAAGPAAGEGWQSLEQPELKDALEHAPAVQTESLGEPAHGVNVWERWLVPNPDGKSWDVLQIYFKEYYGPTWLYAIDLGTGQVNKQRLADGHQFYLSGRALGFDGKYYIATPSRKTWSMDLFVYDPATNTLQERGEIVPGLGGEVRPLVTGPDGRIYGTGTRGNQVGLYIYDPKLGKVVKDFGAVGPSHPNGAWSRYVMGVDDTHAYIASGMIPAWYLVAVNLETGEQKVLLESPTERVMDIIESLPGAYARVPQEGGASNKEYWLYRGQAIAKTNDTPPWPKQASPWDKAVPKPEVYFDQIDPDAQGNAVLWHRPRQDAASRAKGERGGARPEGRGAREERTSTAQWKSVRLEGVPSYPHRINPMSLLPDGRLYGTGDDYAGVFVFDPRTDQTTILGPRPGLAPYTQILCGGKLYSSGYSGGHLFVYDPSRPWTLSKGGPPGHPAIDQADARSNPRYLGDFDRTTRVRLMHSSALGADGRIYFGGFGLRHYTGGGFGWYDPKTQKMDGFWEPLSGYAVQWIAPALNGKLIVISTIKAPDELKNNHVPDEAKLFVYDVSEHKIVRQIVPIAKGHTTGLIREVAPGRLLGLTSAPDRAGSILYGVDAVAGDVLFTKALPSPVSVDDHWPHWVDPSYEYNAFVRGPDGFVWTYLRDVLVRIDPKEASVHVVGKIDPVGWPTFVGNDVYLSGPEQLRRIRNIVPAHQAQDALPDVRVVQLPDGALVPDVAMDKACVLHMVYGLGDDAWYVHSSDNGRTFSPPVRVNTEGKVTLKMGERGPKLALCKGGSIHVVWADQWSPGVKVYPRYSRSLDGGKTFEPPRALASLFGIDGLTVAADNEGDVVAFFHHVTAGQQLEVPEAHRLYLARSTDNGATFGPEQRMTIEGMDDLACSMCMMRARITADGNVCLALRVANDNIRDFFLLRSPKRENAFTPLRVNEDRWELKKCPMCGPELTLDPAGRMLCAFMSRHRVYWSALDEGRFTLHVATPANENDEIYPAAFGDGKGHVLMVWQVGPMAVGRTATVKWALYGNDGAFSGKQGTVGVSTSGTKPTAFVGTDGAFYIVTTAK